MSYQLPPHIQLIAHRGNSGPSPENTRLAIEQAITMGVDMVEVDVHLSRDGVPVLVHSPTLERTTNGFGRVHHHTLAELKQLDAGSWKGDRFAGEQILTLTEALELARHRVPLNLDLKMPTAIQAVITAVRYMDMLDQVVITGCTRRSVKKIRAQEPNLMVLLNLNQSMELLAQHGPALLFRQACLSQTRHAGAVGININHIYLNQELVTEVHQAGLTVWSWTVDDERRFQELLDLGLDSITTNWPERMLLVMKRVVETHSPK
jgi:glycerophosphoryl diester phosphodiesterase